MPKSTRKKDRYSQDCISRSLLEVKDHQLRVIEHMNNLDKEGIIAVHGVGTGKTLTGVVVSQCYLDKYPNDNVFVITPVSLQDNFRKELDRYGADSGDRRYKYYTMTKFVNRYEANQIDTRRSLIIIDEAHNLRNIKSKSTQIMIRACAPARKILLLTATPVYNSSDDINTLVSMIRQQGRFLKGDMYEHPNVLNCMTSFHDQQDRSEFPELTTKDVFLQMKDSFYEKYKQIEQNMAHKFIHGVRDSANLVPFYNGVRRATNRLESEESPKVNWIIDKIRKSKRKEKFVIFSHFIKSGVNAVEERLEKLGIDYAVISGSLSKRERTHIVNQYNRDEIKVLFITKAGAEGLDLKRTRYIILVEPSWNMSSVEQIIGRAVRFRSHEDLPEEKRVVTAYRLFLVNENEYKRRKEIMEDNRIMYDPEHNVKLTIDFYLRNFANKKQNTIESSLETLREKSIEYLSNKDCKQPINYDLLTKKSTKKAPKKSVKKSIKKAPKKSTKKSVKKSTNKAPKKSTKKSVKKAPKKTPKKSTKKSVKKAPKKTPKKSGKRAPKKSVKKSVKKVSKKSTKKSPKSVKKFK
jgi:superfamily II DNA or RNA helicase